MLIIKILYTTYQNGKPHTNEDIFLSSGLRKPAHRSDETRIHYEFNTEDGIRRFNETDITELTELESWIGDPTEEMIQDYPKLNWNWYDTTADGTPITAVLSSVSKTTC